MTTTGAGRPIPGKPTIETLFRPAPFLKNIMYWIKNKYCKACGSHYDYEEVIHTKDILTPLFTVHIVCGGYEHKGKKGLLKRGNNAIKKIQRPANSRLPG